jgi:hypothetical protein
MCVLGCRGVGVLPLLGGFSFQVYLPASLQEFTLGSILSGSSF